MRSAASVCSRAIFAASIACWAVISASSIVRVRAISSHADALVGGDPLGIDCRHLHDAQLFRRLSGRDLGLLDRPRPLDLAAARLLLVDDPQLGHRAFLEDARLLDDFARLDLGFFDGARALDLGLAHFAFGGDAGGVDGALVGDARLLDSLARRNLDFLDRARALDFLLADLALRGDARFADRLLVGDARLFDRFTRRNLRLLGFGLAQSAFAGDLGTLHRASHLDVALLSQAGRFAVALDVQRLSLGLQIARADLDHRILFDVVAQLPAVLDVLHQPSETLGVEPVRGIEEFEVRLIEVGDCDRLKLEAVLRQRLLRLPL